MRPRAFMLSATEQGMLLYRDHDTKRPGTMMERGEILRRNIQSSSHFAQPED